MTAGERFSKAANLPLAQVPMALNYLSARLAEADGELTLTTIEIRPDYTRYWFEPADDGQPLLRTWVDRPLGWPATDEVRAYLAYARIRGLPRHVALHRYDWASVRRGPAEWGVWLHGQAGVN